MIQHTPVINNKGMYDHTFVYSDGKFDYCIVNGESLTKYYGKEYGEYESCSIHRLADPLSALDYSSSLWMSVLLRYDTFDTKYYKKRKELLKQIADRNETDIFGYEG